MTDSELIDRCAKGDETAFLALYELYSGCLYRFAYRLLGSQQLAEDTTQECFASLIRNFRRFDASRGPLRTYLFATIRNLAQKQFRQSGNEVDLVCISDLPDHSATIDLPGILYRDTALGEHYRTEWDAVDAKVRQRRRIWALGAASSLQGYLPFLASTHQSAK